MLVTHEFAGEHIVFAIEPNGDGEFRTANVVFAEALTL